MLRCAIYGMGRWGQTLVNAVQETSDKITFTAGIAVLQAIERSAEEGRRLSIA